MSDDTFALTVLVMAATVFVTRCSGALLMSTIRQTPAVERLLAGVSVSVLAALVASSLAQSEPTSSIAVAFAIAAMLITRKIIAAMAAGMLYVIVQSHWLPA